MARDKKTERNTANDELPLVPRRRSDDLATALSSPTEEQGRKCGWLGLLEGRLFLSAVRIPESG